MMCFLGCPAKPAKVTLLLALAIRMFCGIGNDHHCLLWAAHAFAVPSIRTSSLHHHALFEQHSKSKTRLFGLSEWRQSRVAAGGPDPHPQPQPLLLLPFATTDFLTLGQSTTVVLKEGRYYDLFQDCIDDYDSIMGMTIMGDDGLWDTLVLCDISDFDVDAGYRGKVTVSVTLRAVGRARLVQLVQMKPVMMGLCLEMVDDDDTTGTPPADNDDVGGGSTSTDSDEGATIIAEELLGDIESTLQTLGLESRYMDALELAQRTLVEGSAMKEDLLDDQTMLRRVTAASWAVFGVCTPGASGLITSCLREAMAATTALERLKLGRKALLEMMYSGSDMTNTSAVETSGDMMEFG